MKKIIGFTFGVAACALLFTACSKSPKAKTTTTHFVSATSSTIGTFYSSGSMVSAGGAAGAKIEIDATSLGGATLTLYMNPYSATTGFFPISGLSVGGVYHSGTYDTVISSVHGNITLTSVTPDVIGTFSYTGSDSSVFSGSFNVPAP